MTKKFDITCPHCKTTYKCTPGGVGTHCFDYKIVGGGEIVGRIETGELECPKCGKMFKAK